MAKKNGSKAKTKNEGGIAKAWSDLATKAVDLLDNPATKSALVAGLTAAAARFLYVQSGQRSDDGSEAGTQSGPTASSAPSASRSVSKTARKAMPVAKQAVPASRSTVQPEAPKRPGRPPRVGAQQSAALEKLGSPSPVAKRGRPPKIAATPSQPIETPAQVSGGEPTSDLPASLGALSETPAPTKARGARKSPAPASSRRPGRPRRAAAPMSSAANSDEMLHSPTPAVQASSEAAEPHIEQPVSSAPKTERSNKKTTGAASSRARTKLSVAVPTSVAAEPALAGEGSDPTAA